MRPYLLAFLIFVSGQVYASTGLAGDTVCVAGVGDIMLGTDFPSGTSKEPLQVLPLQQKNVLIPPGALFSGYLKNMLPA